MCKSFYRRFFPEMTFTLERKRFDLFPPLPIGLRRGNKKFFSCCRGWSVSTATRVSKTETRVRAGFRQLAELSTTNKERLPEVLQPLSESLTTTTRRSVRNGCI